MLLIIPLGSNDADGNLDAESPARVELVLRRYREAVDAGKACRVLPSGGTDPAFAFNPTPTPHWEYVSTALLAAGLPEDALIQPGMPALHTVDEAIMARQFLLDADGRYNELLVITSDFHASRVRHLFGVAIGAHARCEIAMRSEHAGLSRRGARPATGPREEGNQDAADRTLWRMGRFCQGEWPRGGEPIGAVVKGAGTRHVRERGGDGRWWWWRA